MGQRQCGLRSPRAPRELDVVLPIRLSENMSAGLVGEVSLETSLFFGPTYSG